MANAIFMFVLLVVIGEAFVIWLMNDELKRRPRALIETMSLSEWEKIPMGTGTLMGPPLEPRGVFKSMTAKDIAAGNLTRQVQRRGKSWADIRNRVESAFEHDPENDRAKRVEKFQGEN